MNQQGNNNNIQIGSMGSGNNVVINQQYRTTRNSGAEYIVLDNPASVENYTEGQIRNRVLIGVGIALVGVSLFADILGIATYFGLNRLQALPIVVACLVVALINAKAIRLWWLPKDDNTDRYLPIWNKFVHKGHDGKYTLYRKTAPCNYPLCNGTIVVVPAPPRAQHKHKFAGVCSVGGREHSYAVDFNGVGVRRQFDWRPIKGK